MLIQLVLIVGSSTGIYLAQINQNTTGQSKVFGSPTNIYYATETAFADNGATADAQNTKADAQTNASATAFARAKATEIAPLISANPDPYPPYNEKLVLLDPLNNNQSGYQWSENSTPYGSCQFTGETIHVNSCAKY